ncbi:ABC transporter ATP-binding protein [Paenibacillus baekrokdamisoli]|uniref:ABC transporter ATP-binding protein n=1 Tax=Paenibacillus baekrokdamisoli TaxID=1712516 RepID=A0A3G9J2K0_9BACL|nr:ABC transporter ATP-binding protein [Paenibacillus baekrokdamisoli]MBB3068370.1 ABC-type bacteriocin/lantibiotic exporter with double-glycine peptidase domain [Paenibacillus baekrokdamisoli]BBH22585.1 ABC transporter ATP-binding protein [Paenibacillus baekrokdamisoli]
MKKLFDRVRFDTLISLREFLRMHKFNLSILACMKIGLLLTGIASPYLFKLLIDEVMIKHDTSILLVITMGFICIYLVETLLQYFQMQYSNRFSMKFSLYLRKSLWKKIMNFDFLLKTKYSGGDLKNRINEDVDLCEKFVTSQVLDYGFFFILSIVNGTILLFINWKLALFGFFMVPLSFWMVRWLGGGVRKTSESYRYEWGKYEAWLQETLRKVKEIKALGIERRQSIDFTRHWKVLSRLFFKRQMYWYGNRSFIAFKDFFITRMNLYFLGGLFIFKGELTVGSLIIFMKYYEQFFTGINSINNLDIELQKDSSGIKRVLEILKINTKSHSRKVQSEFKGEIRLSNVSFIYDEKTNEGVKNINLTISPGEKIAIVGSSGSGKSTLLKLMSGVCTPSQGTVYIDGIPLEEYEPQYLYKQMEVVMQKSYIFNLSITENLMLVNSKASKEEIEAICEKADIHNQIKDFPEGYGTFIGENGVKLSGGQKQRIVIARSLLKKAKILMLDEATSNLDGKSEQKVLNSIRENQHQTVITIAHSKSAISYCNRVIVLEKGELIDDLRQSS